MDTLAHIVKHLPLAYLKISATNMENVCQRQKENMRIANATVAIMGHVVSGKKKVNKTMPKTQIMDRWIFKTNLNNPY